MKGWQVGFLIFLAGCKVGPVYCPPDVEIPCEWQSSVPESFSTDPAEDIDWWKRLQDPLLDELMEYARTQNFDLKIAAIRVLQARVEIKAKAGDLYPHVDGVARSGRVLFSKDDLGPNLPIESNRNRRHLNFYELGFDAVWELDFFGLTAHEIAAAKANEEAIQEALCGVWLTLSAEIAKNYIELRGHQLRLQMMKQSSALMEDALQWTQDLWKRGVLNESDFLQAKADWNQVKAEEAPLEIAITRAIHRLSVLLGYPPGDLFECLAPNSKLPEAPMAISIGIPSELLRRRPDIRKAERELAAATERIGSAVASLFPRFSLRGFVGDIAAHSGSLFSASSASWFAGPQVLVPIFNSRLLLQDVEYNKLATRQALYTYQKTVLEALEESENAIAAFKQQESRLLNSEGAYHSHQKRLAFAEELYRTGVQNNFELAKAKQGLFSAENALIQSRVDFLLNYVALYKALGGSCDLTCD